MIKGKQSSKDSETDSRWFIQCLRCEGVIQLGSEVVWIKIKHPNHEGHEHHYEDHHEFKYVFYSPAQRDLQRTEALVGWKDIRDPREAQNHCDGIKALGDQLRVWRNPVDTS